MKKKSAKLRMIGGMPGEKRFEKYCVSCSFLGKSHSEWLVLGLSRMLANISEEDWKNGRDMLNDDRVMFLARAIEFLRLYSFHAQRIIHEKDDRRASLTIGDLIALHDGAKIEVDGGFIHFWKGALYFEKGNAGYNLTSAEISIELPSV